MSPLTEKHFSMTPASVARLACGSIALLLSMHTPAIAQQSIAEANVLERGPAIASRVTALAPSIDGQGDDAIWTGARAISGFVQRNPDQGQPGTQNTEARIAFTDDALFVIVRAWDTEADQISANLTRRDEGSPSDWIGVMVDSYNDGRTAFEFRVNPAGVKQDFYRFDDSEMDPTWDAVWNVVTTTDAEGWTAEFEIPFSQLRFPKSESNTFGFNISRTINRNNELQFWRLIPRETSSWVSRFGKLVGIEGITPPRRLEIQPYSVASLDRSQSIANDPFNDGRSQAMSLGADFKYGINSSLTLTATVNPDFGQVEADPAQVNLSAFETFFAEQRPFFNEGLDIFQVKIGDSFRDQLFYTRRIGRSPQGSANERGGFSESVNQTTILSAAKLTGKTSNGWTIGLTSALTDEELASVIDSGGTRHGDVVEPMTSYQVGRLSRDFRNGQTVLGFMGTAVNRHMDANVNFLRSSAYAFGTDFSHRFRNDTYNLSLKLTGSSINGSEESIAAAQLSSARYFQRPDNDYSEFDPTRTSLGGYAASASIGKHAGGNWVFNASGDYRSPGFEINDLGFLSNADQFRTRAGITRRWLTPGKVFRRVTWNVGHWANFTSRFERENLAFNTNLNFQLLNYWNGYIGAGRQIGGLGTAILRGGPGILRPGNNNVWAGLESDGRKNLRVGLDAYTWRQDETGVEGFSVSPSISWRPASNMDFSLSPDVWVNNDTWQYLTTSSINGQTEYVLGDLKQTMVSAQFRGNFTFTPDLSLQVYAEPFVSSGKYDSFSRVNNPRANDFWTGRLETFDETQVISDQGDVTLDFDRDGAADLNLGNPDFSFLSFRSNVVLRWEYKLGSTFFLVWQHGRTGSNGNGDFSLNRNVGELFELDAQNTFVVKFNYWWSP